MKKTYTVDEGPFDDGWWIFHLKNVFQKNKKGHWEFVKDPVPNMPIMMTNDCKTSASVITNRYPF